MEPDTLLQYLQMLRKRPVSMSLLFIMVIMIGVLAIYSKTFIEEFAKSEAAKALQPEKDVTAIHVPLQSPTAINSPIGLSDEMTSEPSDDQNTAISKNSLANESAQPDAKNKFEINYFGIDVNDYPSLAASGLLKFQSMSSSTYKLTLSKSDFDFILFELRDSIADSVVYRKDVNPLNRSLIKRTCHEIMDIID